MHSTHQQLLTEATSYTYNKKYTLIICYAKLSTGFTENMCAKVTSNFKTEQKLLLQISPETFTRHKSYKSKPVHFHQQRKRF